MKRIFNLLRHNKKGFTLAETLVALVLTAVIFVLGAQLINMISKTTVIGKTQADIATQTRFMSETINNAVRFSDSIFTIPRKSFTRDKYTKGWAYIGLQEGATIPGELTSDGKPLSNAQALVHVKYLGDSKPTDLSPAVDETFVENSDGWFLERIVGFSHLDPVSKRTIKYNLTFTPADPAATDQAIGALRYRFTTQLYDENGIIIGDENDTDIDTVLNGVNNRQVMYKGSLDNPATALAYHDATYTGAGDTSTAVGANVAFVCDLSGSMYNSNDIMITIPPETSPKRVTRYEAMSYSAGNFFDTLNEDGVSLIISSFTDDAKWDGTFKGSENQKLQDLLTKWDQGYLDYTGKYTKKGETNLGYGMSIGYHRLKEVSDSQGVQAIPNYIILLSDGESNNYTPGRGGQPYFWSAQEYMSPSQGHGPSTDYPLWAASQIAQDPKLKPIVFIINLSGSGGLPTDYNINKRELLRLVAEFTATPVEYKYARYGVESSETLSPVYNKNGANPLETHFYEVTDGSDFENAFKEISNTIAKDTWLIEGPKM